MDMYYIGELLELKRNFRQGLIDDFMNPANEKLYRNISSVMNCIIDNITKVIKYYDKYGTMSDKTLITSRIENALKKKKEYETNINNIEDNEIENDKYEFKLKHCNNDNERNKIEQKYKEYKESINKQIEDKKQYEEELEQIDEIIQQNETELNDLNNIERTKNIVEHKIQKFYELIQEVFCYVTVDNNDIQQRKDEEQKNFNDSYNTKLNNLLSELLIVLNKEEDFSKQSYLKSINNLLDFCDEYKKKYNTIFSLVDYGANEESISELLTLINGLLNCLIEFKDN